MVMRLISRNNVPFVLRLFRIVINAFLEIVSITLMIPQNNGIGLTQNLFKKIKSKQGVLAAKLKYNIISLPKI